MRENLTYGLMRGPRRKLLVLLYSHEWKKQKGPEDIAEIEDFIKKNCPEWQ